MVWQEWQVAGWQMEGMALATRLCAVLDVSKSSPGTQKRDTLSRFIFVSAKSPGKRYIVIYMYIYIFIYIYVCMYIYTCREKSFRNLVKSNFNQIVFNIFRLIWKSKRKDFSVCIYTYIYIYWIYMYT